MFYQATIHILICGVKTQNQACAGIGRMFRYVPGLVVDWAYTRDSADHILLPVPRPDLRHMGYEEGEFVQAISLPESVYGCPYCGSDMGLAEHHYDQEGYSTASFLCPACFGQTVVKNIPPEVE